jgi:uncharacterized protein (UPF0261 family)/ABC-type branched-subunit amino acid transport system ATPase component
MSESMRMTPVLEVRGLDVYYGRSHALQGVDLTLPSGILSVVGRNGMGKTTLCKTIMGLVKASGGSVRFRGEDITGWAPAQIARAGIGYVPQGRRLWRSLTVDEHLRVTAGLRRGPWTIERIYDTFPRLAERKNNGGGQLSGGEQQMLAISRALLSNPALLIMDEPTEGLAPVIVSQVEDMLLTLGEQGDVAVLVIEQNITVATTVAENVAIMVNGRINRIIEGSRLAGDRELQQRMLGVGRHSDEDGTHAPEVENRTAPVQDNARRPASNAPVKVYQSNPVLPTRWSQPVPLAKIEATARVLTSNVTSIGEREKTRGVAVARVASHPAVIVVGTLDTKAEELRYIGDLIAASGLRVRMVDVSTSGQNVASDVTAREIALHHGRGSMAFGTDRGVAVAAMADAFAHWVRQQTDIVGMIAAGGSGGSSIAAAGMRELPIGTPKLIVSSVASGNVGPYVGPSDITMMYSVTDVQGLNRISRRVLANAANAMVGMVRSNQTEAGTPASRERPRPSVGLTMFGVTTPAVQRIAGALAADYECLVFHATGVGGQSMEKLVDEGMITGVIDLTTTEIADLLVGGILPATEDRMGAVIRTKIPYVGSLGALDMVNFGPRATVPERFANRQFHIHNPTVTLMRTTEEENDRIGRFIGERLNRMEGPVRFLIPERGVSALDAPSQPFWNPAADSALIRSLESTVRQTPQRQLIRVNRNINEPEFAAAVVTAFQSVMGGPSMRRPASRSTHA